MDVRVWGVIEDRLIELRFEPATGEPGLRIVGLPEDRVGTTADRVRAALLNSGLMGEVPPAVIRLEPVVRAGSASDLDLAIALAILGGVGSIGQDVRWVLATGRLGPDGTVLARGLGERLTLADVLGSLCHTRVLGFEHMFGKHGA